MTLYIDNSNYLAFDINSNDYSYGNITYEIEREYFDYTYNLQNNNVTCIIDAKFVNQVASILYRFVLSVLFCNHRFFIQFLIFLQD